MIQINENVLFLKIFSLDNSFTANVLSVETNTPFVVFTKALTNIKALFKGSTATICKFHVSITFSSSLFRNYINTTTNGFVQCRTVYTKVRTGDNRYTIGEIIGYIRLTKQTRNAINIHIVTGQIEATNCQVCVGTTTVRTNRRVHGQSTHDTSVGIRECLDGFFTDVNNGIWSFHNIASTNKTYICYRFC